MTHDEQGKRGALNAQRIEGANRLLINLPDSLPQRIESRDDLEETILAVTDHLAEWVALLTYAEGTHSIDNPEGR